MSEQDPLKSIYQFSIENHGSLTEKQKKIIAAAIQVFSKRGYSASSTSEIAKKAGVAEGTIFRHYKTKKDLLLSIVTPVMSRMVAPFVIRDVDKILHKDYPSFEDFVRALLFNRIEFIKKNLPVIKIMLQEIPFHPELKEAFVTHVATKVYERLKVIVEHFQEKGEIVDLPPDIVIRLAGSSVAGYLLSRFIIAPELDWDDELEIERTIQYMMNGLKC